MFNSAQNIHISGGSFSNITVIQARSRTGVDIIRDNYAPGAMLDSRERFDAPRCSEKTREAIILEVLRWIESDKDSTSKILWLYGSAGVGKSALEQTIGEACRKNGRLLASFFFSRSARALSRRDGNCLVPTLAYQLTLTHPATRRPIEDHIANDPDLFLKSREIQMEYLFVRPLTMVSKPIGKKSYLSIRRQLKKIIRKFGTESSSAQPRLVAIDGLDECADPDIQCDILKNIARVLPQLPYPLRFLIASRPEPHIRHTFNHDASFKALGHDAVRRIDLDQDENAPEDIRQFLEDGFREIRASHPARGALSSWPSVSSIKALVKTSSSQFIFAATALRYIQSPKHRPDKRLQVILGISVPPTNDEPFAQLDALYAHVFLLVDDDKRETIWRVLGIIYLARQPEFALKNLQIGTSLTDLEKIVGLETGDIAIYFDPLSSLLTVPEDGSSSITFLHASVFDYLLDSTRSRHMTLDVKLAHESLAKYLHSNLKVYGGLVGDLYYLQHCYLFLSHSNGAHLSDELRGYLTTCNFLYNGVLDLSKFPHISISARVDICIIISRLFDVFMRKDFDDGRQLLIHHATQIVGHLALPSNIDSKSGAPHYDDSFMYQVMRQVYTAIFAPCPAIMVPPDSQRADSVDMRKLLRVASLERGTEGSLPLTSPLLQAHLAMLVLPYLICRDNVVDRKIVHNLRIIGGEHGRIMDTSTKRLLYDQISEYLQSAHVEKHQHSLQNREGVWNYRATYKDMTVFAWSHEIEGSCCLLTSKLGHDLDEKNSQAKITQVRFTVKSHDQGWTSETSYPSPYIGSWTWFEAVVIHEFRDENSPVTSTISDAEDSIQEALNLCDASNDPRVVTVKNAPYNADKWLIQYNQRASHQPKQHQVVWTADDDDDDRKRSDIFNHTTGAGFGEGFVQSLNFGDRIAVMAKARFSGWENHVCSVEVEVFYSDPM